MAKSEKKKEMATKYNELKAIRSKKCKVILGSADEDNRLIAENEAIHLKALNVIQATLNL